MARNHVTPKYSQFRQVVLFLRAHKHTHTRIGAVVLKLNMKVFRLDYPQGAERSLKPLYTDL